jgi:leucyl aminopeptidase (aminopeptidase T)
MTKPPIALLYLLLAASAAPAFDYDAMAARIVKSLRLARGERVLLHPDPEYFRELVDPLRRRLRAAGAREVTALDEATGVYLWLPLRPERRELPPAERDALARWLDQGGSHRAIHFHWADGSRDPDGLPGEHAEALDDLYQEALETGYESIVRAQDRAIALLRPATVRVRTPEGTDISFRVGNRPFNKQDGDASADRMKSARIRIDREVELPAGVLRVAPIEESVNGVIAIPQARIGAVTAENIRVEIRSGVAVKVEAGTNAAAAQSLLSRTGATGGRFREFCLGFHPRLLPAPGARTLPYYGYGAGVVRLSFGDNQELGGAVKGGAVRWFFFPGATVEADGAVLVRDGKLIL